MDTMKDVQSFDIRVNVKKGHATEAIDTLNDTLRELELQGVIDNRPTTLIKEGWGVIRASASRD